MPDMMTAFGRDLDRETISSEFNYMVENLLPRLADLHDWSVRYNHCFRRICYDVAVGQQWDEFIEESPAYEKMALSDLVNAYSVATVIALVGEPILTGLNEVSLMYREETDLEGNKVIDDWSFE